MVHNIKTEHRNRHRLHSHIVDTQLLFTKGIYAFNGKNKMKVKCPKCASFNTYSGYGNEMACMMCGKRWYPQRTGGIMSRIGECVNCNRETSIVAKGLCGVCYTSVHGKFDEGSDPYIAALLKAKERCTVLKTDPVKPTKGWNSGCKDSKKATLEALEEKRSNLTAQLIKINQAIEVIEAL
jgi:hypothetical protein